MSELNEIYARLVDGICPSPPESEVIIKDIRRQRAIHEGKGTKARSRDDDQIDEILKVIEPAMPKADLPMRRRL